jgi:hypothetical protein
MNVAIVVLFAAAGILLLSLACAAMLCLEKNLPSEKYDERQKVARSNACRFSLVTGMAYNLGLLIHFVLHTGKSEWVVEPFLLLMIGIFLQLLSFHIYCLMSHSALPLGQKPLPTIIGYSILGGMYMMQYFVQYIPEDTPWLTGAESFNLFRLLLSLFFFSLALMHLIAYLWKEKEA